MTRSPNLLARLAAQGSLSARRLWRQMPWYLPPDGIEAGNLRSLYADTVWFGVLSGVVATYVAVFALRLGATTGQIGWLTALPALVSIFWSLPAARLIERQRRPLSLILVSGALQRLIYLAMAAAPWLMRVGLVEVLIALNTLVALPAAVISTAITALIPELAAAERRGQVVSVRWLLMAAAETVAALVAGQLLGLMPVPLNYQVVISAGTALSLLSLYYLRRLRVPDSALARPHLPKGQAVPHSLRDRLAGILAQREFVRFAAASFVFYWGIYLPAALWSIIRVRDLQASDAWIGVIAVVHSISVIAGYVAWGKIAAQRGNRWLLILCAIGVTLYAFFTALVPSIEWMIPTSVLGGVAWSGCNLALFNILLAFCPADRRPTYIALYTTLVNVTAFLGPLLGAILADWIGIRWAFVASGVARLFGLLLFWRLL